MGHVDEPGAVRRSRDFFRRSQQARGVKEKAGNVNELEVKVVREEPGLVNEKAGVVLQEPRLVKASGLVNEPGL